MKTENEKLDKRNIVMAAILLVLCVFSITAMCYPLGIYSYIGRNPEKLTENGFGLLDGRSELFDSLYDVYYGFQICDIAILVLGVLSFAAFGYYLYSLFDKNARLKLRFSMWTVSILNLACSVAYLAEGIVLAVQCNGLFESIGMREIASVVTVAYVPIILSAASVAALAVAYRLMAPMHVADVGAYSDEPEKCEATADALRDDSADLGMSFSYADGERLTKKDMRYLKRLARLHDDGTITDEEYEEEKARIFNREFH